MRDKVQAAEAATARVSARHTAAEQRAGRLEADLAAALEAAAAEARTAKLQVGGGVRDLRGCLWAPHAEHSG